MRAYSGRTSWVFRGGLASADDAPGAAAGGVLLMMAGVVLGVRAAHNRVPTWADTASLATRVEDACNARAHSRMSP